MVDEVQMKNNNKGSLQVTWSSTQFFLIQSILHGWHSKQLDFLLAYPQADAERELYMEIPKGVTVEGSDDRDKYALRIQKNLYGLNKLAGYGTSIWYEDYSNLGSYRVL
jgi:hypothetical protein